MSPSLLSSPPQVELRRLGALHQNLRQPGLPDPDGALRAVPQRRHQPLRPQQVLQRREAREPEAVRPGVLPRAVEDRRLVGGWVPLLFTRERGTTLYYEGIVGRRVDAIDFAFAWFQLTGSQRATCR